MMGTTFTHRGLTLQVVRGTTDDWEVHTVGGYGVWFATDAQLRAAGVHVPA